MSLHMFVPLPETWKRDERKEIEQYKEKLSISVANRESIVNWGLKRDEETQNASSWTTLKNLRFSPV